MVGLQKRRWAYQAHRRIFDVQRQRQLYLVRLDLLAFYCLYEFCLYFFTFYDF